MIFSIYSIMFKYILLKLILPVSFYFFNMATRNLKIIYVGCIIFQLDSAALYTLPHYSTDLFNKYLLNSFFVPALG